jgi:hypothetical protein
MSDPIITTTERYSDTLNLLHMSDGTQLWGCTWPKCNFVSGNKDSIPSHYKHHVGQAAQRRRAIARPRGAQVSNEVLETALALLDMTQMLVDKLAAFDDEYTAIRKQVDDMAIDIEGLRLQIETNRVKAGRYDLMVQMMKDAGYDEPEVP